MRKLQSIHDIIALYVTPLDPQSCWNWCGTKRTDGRGQFYLNKKCYAPPRITWEIYHGTIPIGYAIGQSCRNKLCCNPSHLYLSISNRGASPNNATPVTQKCLDCLQILPAECFHKRPKYNRLYSYCKKCNGTRTKRIAYNKRIYHYAATLTEYLSRHVTPGATTACWEWQGRRNTAGYGEAIFKRKRRNAHVFAYIVTYGDIPAGLYVCHTCDNPPCCNPAHLFLGTAKDNVQDAIRKGRR